MLPKTSIWFLVEAASNWIFTPEVSIYIIILSSKSATMNADPI